MKEYNITISIGSIAKDVYRITANAAMLRGDAELVATEDNDDMVFAIIERGINLLKDSFGGYYIGRLSYRMPQSWPDMSNEVKDLCELFLVNFTLNKWYELSGYKQSNNYMSEAKQAAIRIEKILNIRRKPI